MSAIEQIVSVAPKGTAVGLCDLGSALVSGHFLAHRGGVMPGVASFLHQHIEDEAELAARSRRAWKALTYGSYNTNEMIDKLKQIVEREGRWQPLRVGGYVVKSFDFTAFNRHRVRGLESKAYDGDAGRAVPAVPLGVITTVGAVQEQRIALIDSVVTTKLDANEPVKHKKALYKEVAKQLAKAEELTGEKAISVADAGFKLIDAALANIEGIEVRLAKNCTFGQTPGKIPERKGKRGRPPTRHQAESVRPLERTHNGKLIPATPPDETVPFVTDDGKIVTAQIWDKVYFLERHLDGIECEKTKERLRPLPIKVMVFDHPDYDHPLVIGTFVLSLTPPVAYKLYVSRWPVEGVPQAAKYILSGGGGRHFVHHPTAMQRLPILSFLFGSLLKYTAATLPPFRTGFWDHAPKPTYGRLLRYLNKVAIPLSKQLSKKESVTDHLPVGYESIRLSQG